MTFFSTNSHEANWQPTIIASSTHLHHNLLLKFLGVTLDSQSLLKAIQSGSTDTTDLRRMLNKRAGKATLLWIPGHHGIAGNEEADACAKQAAAITDGAPRLVSYAAASALIRRTLTDTPPCHCRTKEVYTKTFSWPTDCRAVSSRRDAVLLARL